MALIKMRWTAQMGFRVGAGPSVRFKGREPFSVTQQQEKALMSLGVFEKISDGILRYSAPVKMRCKCPKESQCAWVDKDGWVEVDPEHLRDDLKSANVHLELEAEGKPVNPALFSI